ncbi:unnamed protein product [Adineta steineri]|uniref:Uncharacterized protein n=2 Tax=Adineta steineri TaxID=433720 RepID=A0A815MLS3_9BILA|nr:unnamed protein product [Adineta steineri]
MLSTEEINETITKPTLEGSDGVSVREEDELEELPTAVITDENEEKTSADLTNLKQSNLPTNLKTSSTALRSDAKRVRINQPRESLSNSNNVVIKRDPVVESIIESRKLSLIDNSYTRLAQSSRPPQRSSTFDMRPPTRESESAKKDRVVSSQSEKKVTLPVTIDYDVEGWDEGLTEEIEKDNISQSDKSCVQLYDEICKRLNICPCSIILRSLNTTKINLGNYGLGPRGCVPLVVGLIRNTTVISLNLSGNNIGSAGMSHIYQIITENAYIEEYDLSFNDLGTKGNRKLATAVSNCSQLKTLNVAGNGLTSNDIMLLLSKLEDLSYLRNLNISHNELDEEGGKFVANWLGENHLLAKFDASWCSIRLSAAKEMAKAIGENNRLESLDLSHNGFSNDTLGSITSSLSSNSALTELNLRGSHFVCRHEGADKYKPDRLITGKDCQLYDMLVAAATNQSLKIFRLGEDHIDQRCLPIILDALSKVENITLEELDLTGIMTDYKLIEKCHLLFVNHPKLKVYVGPVRQTIEYFANNLRNLIRAYSIENEINLPDIFSPSEDMTTTATSITYEQFLDGLRKAKIPFPIALINDIIKYLGQDSEEGSISISNNLMCNQNQVPKNLPLKKRRAYVIDTSTNNVNSTNGDRDENYSNHSPSSIKQSYPQEDPLQIHLPPMITTTTPPSSPHIELLRQQYAYLHASSPNAQHQNLYPPSNFEYLMAQKVLAQQFLDNYRTLVDQHQQNQPCNYTVVEDKHKRTDVTVDEHFRKSLGYNYDKLNGGFLTPDNSSSNSSPTDRTPAESIDEHFARSLGRFWPLSTPSNEDNASSLTESVVDDHFAKALGAKTWEKLKEKS